MKFSKRNLIYLAISLSCAFLAIILFLFLKSTILYVNDVRSKFDFMGFRFIFGFTAHVDGTDIVVFSFNFMALLPIITTIIAVILHICGIKNKKIAFSSSIFFIISALLYILSPEFIHFTRVDTGMLDVNFNASVGAYLAAFFAGIAGIFTMGRMINDI